ncbi:hypothetical protein AAVH_23114 [Aphelenchoides avenae]|nr:hypothetical protein AAVH_23114 [Aphelenchus avenae]
MRIFIDQGAQCSRPLPQGPGRLILEEVLHFAARDDFDTCQLVCRHIRRLVDDRADALALRPFYDVLLVWRVVRTDQASFTLVTTGQRVCGAKFAHFDGHGSLSSSKRMHFDCFNASQEELNESLLRMSTLGVTQFHFRVQECRILPGPVGQPTLTEIQQLVDEFLRNSPGERVSFLLPTFCPFVRAVRIIEKDP